MYLLCIHTPHPSIITDNGELSTNLRRSPNVWMVVQIACAVYLYRAWR